jgi:hypothetical protein
VAEKLVAWGLGIAEEEGLWAVVACEEDRKRFYEELGFRHRGTVTVHVPGDDKELNLEWLQKDPSKQASRGNRDG